MQIIKENQHYFTTPSSFNDPFDCRPAVVVRESRLKAQFEINAKMRRNYPKLDKRDRKKITDSWTRKGTPEKTLVQALRDTTSSYGICCFAERYDNLLLWSHYATSHKGVCFRFRTDAIPPHLQPYEVLYGTSRPEIGLTLGDDETILERVILTKAQVWDYEEEWRSIDLPGGPGTKIFPAAAVDGIVLGAAISDRHREAFIAAIGDRGAPFEVIQAEFDPLSYSLNFNSVPTDEQHA